MQILEPIVHETVWGGSKLAAYVKTDCRKIGHLYSVIDTKSMRSQFASGDWFGKTIHDWFEANKARYGLSKYDELPILMALVEAADNLSIQVHPDDKAAAKEGRPFGKNESFYILEAPTTGRMFNGTKVETTEALASLVRSGRTMEGVDSVPVKVGDYVYVVGGTLHAAAAGSLSFEIEENCDATYRFYDFDRVDKNGEKRPLQIEKALSCLHPKQQSMVSSFEPNTTKSERMYELTLVDGKDKWVCPEGMFAFVVLLKGKLMIDGIEVFPGTAVLLEPGESVNLLGTTAMIARPICS